MNKQECAGAQRKLRAGRSLRSSAYRQGNRAERCTYSGREVGVGGDEDLAGRDLEPVESDRKLGHCADCEGGM